MPMEFNIIIEKFDEQLKALFETLCNITLEITEGKADARLWAKLPSFYIGENFVRIIPFKDHINIEAKAVTTHKEALGGYKITPKGMLQIFVGQDIPIDTLKEIICESFSLSKVCGGIDDDGL